MKEKKIIPIPIRVEGAPAAEDAAASACENAEPFALMVLGDSMLPEFQDGEIIIIEPEGLAKDGSFVLAHHNDEYIFRQLVIRDERWYLRPLNDLYPTLEITGPEAVKGVITQKKRPGSRRDHKFDV